MGIKKLVIVSVFILISCNANYNQYEKIGKNQVRTGMWIEKDSAENGWFISKGKYKNNQKKGVWKTYFNDQLMQKDKIKDSIIKTKWYHPNGKIKARGQSKHIIKENVSHWFLSGNWNFYDENGVLQYRKIYHLNQKSDSISLK